MKYVPVILWLTLAGCTVGPDYNQPVFFTDQKIKEVLNLKKPNRFLLPLDFQDPVLSGVIQQALHNAPTVKMALLKLRQARENAKIAEVSNLPTVNLDAKYNAVKESKMLGQLLQEDYYQTGVDMNWEIDIFGGGRRRIEQALAQTNQARENVKNVWISFVAQIITTYLNLRKTEALLQQAQENLKLQREIFKTVSSKFNSGLADTLTLNEASNAVDMQLLQIPPLTAQIKLDQNSLALLVGLLPTELNDLLNTSKQSIVNKDFSYDINSFYELPVASIRKRPDVRMAEEELIAQNAKVGQAVAALYPQINFSGFLGFQSYRAHNLLNKNSYAYSYMPSITIPVFHWNALKRQIKAEKLGKEMAMENYKNTLLTAVNEVKTALIELEKDMKTYITYKKTAQKTDEIADLTFKKYQKGLVLFSTYLQARQNAIAARNNLITANATLYRDVVQFYKSIGHFDITQAEEGQ